MADQLNGRTERRRQGFIPRKLPQLDFRTDAEYVANLVNVNMWS